MLSTKESILMPMFVSYKQSKIVKYYTRVVKWAIFWSL